MKCCFCKDVEMIGIYEISKDGECLYIGQSVNIAKRWWMHRWMLANGRHSNAHLQAIASRYGVDAFKFSVIEETESVEGLTELEKKWINELRPRCNMIEPCESGAWSFTDEARRKISEKNKGKVYSAETRRKLSERARERYSSRPANFKGAHHSEESRRKIAEAKIKYERPTLNKLVSMLIYNGYHSVAKAMGVPKSTVKRWCDEYGIPYKKEDWSEVRACPAR